MVRLITDFNPYMTMFRRISICIFFAISVASNAGELSLRIQASDESNIIELALINESQNNLLISSELGLNVSRFGLRELNLVFTDMQGENYYSKNEIRAAPSGNTFLLKSGHFFGREISLASLVPYYKLSPGRYRLKAVYCKMNICRNIAEGVYSEEVWSNEIIVNVPENFGDQEVKGFRHKD